MGHKFIQIVDFKTSKIDEMRKLDEEWAKAAADQGLTARRGILCSDRDNSGHYLQIVFFDDYESAMDNSENAVTQEFGQKMGALADGEPAFINLDVVEDNNY